jgi:hypothetical protein
VAVKVTFAPLQIVVYGVAMFKLGVKFAFTAVIILFDLAVLVLKQVAFEVKTAETVSLFLRAVLVNVALLVPDAVLLINHWIPGLVPPLLMLAVNVTGVPEQIALDVLLVILIKGLIVLLTTSEMLPDVAVVGEAHAAFEVITTDIVSLLVRVLLEKVFPVAPVT